MGQPAVAKEPPSERPRTQPRRAFPFDEANAYEEHRDRVLRVLARRCGWLDPGEREAILHDAYLVLLQKRRRRELDTGSMSSSQLGAYLVQTAIHKALDAGKRAERKRAEPLGDREGMPPIPDPHRGPEEHAEASQQSVWVQELIAALPIRQQAIVKLRFFLECSPAEIQDHLGITGRTYRRQLERAMATLSERYELVRDGRPADPRGGRHQLASRAPRPGCRGRSPLSAAQRSRRAA